MEGPTLAGAVTGAPPLDLEGRWAVGCGRCEAVAGTNYAGAARARFFFSKQKNKKIDCTQIVASTWYRVVYIIHTIQLYYGCTQFRISDVVQYSIKNTYDTIVL